MKDSVMATYLSVHLRNGKYVTTYVCGHVVLVARCSNIRKQNTCQKFTIWLVQISRFTIFEFFFCRDYSIRVFIFGDIEYLTKCYGLSGSSGKNFTNA